MIEPAKLGWRRVSKAFPCPVCQKPDWCCIGDYAVNCMRIASPKAAENGGWLHTLADAKPVALPPRAAPAPTINATALMRQWQEATPSCAELAHSLGVTDHSLEALGCAWAREHAAWAFPMSDAYGSYVGIRLRDSEGHKWAVRGSHQGLFLPAVEFQETAYICEGPTDTAAGLVLGLFVIGRPSCLGCEAEIARLLRRTDVRRVVIISDRDGPGYNGARVLTSKIPVPSVIVVPPAKDLRQFVNLGGTAAMLSCLTSGMVWNVPKR